MFDKLVNDLETELVRPLPGISAHLRMASYLRQSRIKEYPTPPKDARVAGVLVLFYLKGDTTYLTLMMRTNRGAHSGQVSFPGGGVEEQDEDMVATALREAQEEVGIQPIDVHTIGKLTPLYIPISNSLVNPIVAYSHKVPDYEIDPGEVQYVIEAKLDDLLNPDLHKTTDMTVQGGLKMKDIPYYDVNGHVVWGATAMMLSELLEIVGRLKVNTPY